MFGRKRIAALETKAKEQYEDILLLQNQVRTLTERLREANRDTTMSLEVLDESGDPVSEQGLCSSVPKTQAIDPRVVIRAMAGHMGYDLKFQKGTSDSVAVVVKK